MINLTLYKREMKGSVKTLLIFSSVLTLYIIMIITMFDPDTMDMLEFFAETMPELMAAVGMAGAPVDLTGFISSYLYGMLMLVFPMVFTILRANGLIARYVDRGSMASLISSPIRRSAIAFTQMKVLATGIIVIVLYCTALEIACAKAYFPDETDIPALLYLNLALLCLQLFIGGICFLASCMFSDARYSIGFGAGIPTVMYIFQMLANMGGKAENMKYATFFTLFNADGIVAGETSAVAGAVILFAGAIVLFAAGIVVFCKKDLQV